jgi:hypothetical protein
METTVTLFLVKKIIGEKGSVKMVRRQGATTSSFVAKV